MKRIQALDGPTPGLLDYVSCDGQDANWEGFRSHDEGTAYRELFETLRYLQHGLCGYCEIDITEQDKQIEHVIPQSDKQQGAAGALDPANMMACCRGGTRKTDDDMRWKKPAKLNRSCGEAKANVNDPDFVDPRMLPALPSLTLVRFNGEIIADETACANAFIDANSVNRTIKILGLNVPRLRVAREKRWDALSNSWQENYENSEVMTEAARGELSLLNGGDLPRFFTTSRSYFARHGEEILAEPPQEWI